MANIDGVGAPTKSWERLHDVLGEPRPLVQSEVQGGGNSISVMMLCCICEGRTARFMRSVLRRHYGVGRHEVKSRLARQASHGQTP